MSFDPVKINISEISADYDPNGTDFMSRVAKAYDFRFGSTENGDGHLSDAQFKLMKQDLLWADSHQKKQRKAKKHPGDGVVEKPELKAFAIDRKKHYGRAARDAEKTAALVPQNSSGKGSYIAPKVYNDFVKGYDDLHDIYVDLYWASREPLGTPQQ